MTKQLAKFYADYLNATTWAQRKDGVPMDLLDALSAEEKTVAEGALIQAATLGDWWPIAGLGYLKSVKALDKLYGLLDEAGSSVVRIFIAHAIFEICADKAMIDVVLSTLPTLTEWYELIDVVYVLPDFMDERTDTLLVSYSKHSHYLIAYNAKESIKVGRKRRADQ